MAAKVTAPSLRKQKQSGEPIVVLTAYDVSSASIAEAAGVDAILVGDSLGNVILGHGSTIPVELEDVVYHTRAVARGSRRPLIISDLPFGTYQASVEQAVLSAAKLAKAGAEAVKLEGVYTDEIRAIVKAGLPVMGHVGLTPQSVHNFGGFRVQGKGSEGDRVLEEAKAVEEAGAFAIVLELIPAELSQRITKALSIPTIGIGAGPHCDGQVQVWHDLVGLSESVFKHAKAFAEGRNIFTEAVAEYGRQVRAGTFPGEENSF